MLHQKIKRMIMCFHLLHSLGVKNAFVKNNNDVDGDKNIVWGLWWLEADRNDLKNWGLCEDFISEEMMKQPMLITTMVKMGKMGGNAEHKVRFD